MYISMCADICSGLWAHHVYGICMVMHADMRMYAVAYTFVGSRTLLAAVTAAWHSD